MTHTCVSEIIIISSDNGLSPGRRQAIIWTNAGILLIGPLGINFCEMLIESHSFSFKKMRLKVSSAKWRPFCFGLNVLIKGTSDHNNCQKSVVSDVLVGSLNDGWAAVLGWGLLSQFPPFRYFPNFSVSLKHTLPIEYRVYIWQVSPQLSCGGSCQI